MKFKRAKLKRMHGCYWLRYELTFFCPQKVALQFVQTPIVFFFTQNQNIPNYCTSVIKLNTASILFIVQLPGRSSKTTCNHTAGCCQTIY